MSGRKRQPPVPAEGTADLDGTSVEYSKYISKVTNQMEAIVVDPGYFHACPICLEAAPEVAEHVPPQSLGGRIMTKTCAACNHDFGTAEDHLRRYLDLEVTVLAQATDGSIKGHRAATVALRSVEGEAGIAVVRTANPEFQDIVNTGASKLTVQSVDMRLVVAATLKHAYLAACLHQGEVPQSDDVTRVRAALLATRSRDGTALGNALSKIPYLTLPSWIEADNIYPVLLIEPRAERDLWAFAFGGRFITPWPFPDLEPRAASVP